MNQALALSMLHTLADTSAVAAPPPSNWILTTGLWVDTGVWVDSDVWID